MKRRNTAETLQISKVSDHCLPRNLHGFTKLRAVSRKLPKSLKTGKPANLPKPAAWNAVSRHKILFSFQLRGEGEGGEGNFYSWTIIHLGTRETLNMSDVQPEEIKKRKKLQ